MKHLVLTVALVASVVCAAACGPLPLPGTSAGTQAQAITVPAAAAQRGEIRQTLTYSGDVRARDQITVLPKASGRVQRVLVDLGSSVHAGDVVAELEQDSPEIQVLQARANLAAAQAKLATIRAGARPDDVAVSQETPAPQQNPVSSTQAQGPRQDVAPAQAGVAP